MFFLLNQFVGFHPFPSNYWLDECWLEQQQQHQQDVQEQQVFREKNFMWVSVPHLRIHRCRSHLRGELEPMQLYRTRLLCCTSTHTLPLHITHISSFSYGLKIRLWNNCSIISYILYQFLNKCFCCKMFMNPGWSSRCYIIRPSPGLHGLTMYEGSKPWAYKSQLARSSSFAKLARFISSY